MNDVMDTSREQDWISLGLAPFFARKMVEIYKNDPTGRSLPDDFMRSAGKWNSPESVEISDIRIPGERGLSSVSAKLYRPVHERRKGSRDALLLWLHGGGFSQGSPLWPEAHAVCAEICDRTGISCLNLDYALSRLDAEEGLFPQALEQVVSAWLWAGDSLSKNELGNLSQEASFFLGGASAGANLAAAACLKINQDRLAGQTRLKSPQGFSASMGSSADWPVWKAIMKTDWLLCFQTLCASRTRIASPCIGTTVGWIPWFWKRIGAWLSLVKGICRISRPLGS